MTKPFTAKDARALGEKWGLQPVSSFQTSLTPMDWHCAHGHTFPLSVASLKRRIREGVGACPHCDDLVRADTWRALEFDKAVAGAKDSGLRVLSTVDDYQNQNSLMRVSCDRCATCEAKPIPAAKLARGHTCAVLGRERQQQARRLTAAEVQTLVDSHPMGLSLVSDAEDYVNNRTPLKVRCVNGHVYKATVSDLRRRDRIRGCPHCGSATGQSVMTAILAGFLGADAEVEATPSFLLKDWPSVRGPLRFDAWFPQFHIGNRRWQIAGEYQGPQHFDPAHHYHRTSCHGQEIAFERLQQGDQHKVNACAAEPATALIVVVDRESEASLGQLFADVTSALETAIPEIAACSEYLARKDELSETGALERHLRRHLISQAPLARLKAQLAQRRILVVSYDPIRRRAACKCEVCNHVWIAKANNLLDGVSTHRRGTSCPECAKKIRGKKRRLSEATVLERARRLGWLPAWVPGSYQGQTQKLDWRCATPGCAGRRHADFDHLQRGRTCPFCDSRTRTLGIAPSNPEPPER